MKPLLHRLGSQLNSWSGTGAGQISRCVLQRFELLRSAHPANLQTEPRDLEPEMAMPQEVGKGPMQANGKTSQAGEQPDSRSIPPESKAFDGEAPTDTASTRGAGSSLVRYLRKLGIKLEGDAEGRIAAALTRAAQGDGSQAIDHEAFIGGHSLVAIAQRANMLMGRPRDGGLKGAITNKRGGTGKAAKLQRIRAALIVLRQYPRLPPDWLWSDRPLLEGDPRAWFGLLRHCKQFVKP